MSERSKLYPINPRKVGGQTAIQTDGFHPSFVDPDWEKLSTAYSGIPLDRIGAGRSYERFTSVQNVSWGTRITDARNRTLTLIEQEYGTIGAFLRNPGSASAELAAAQAELHECAVTLSLGNLGLINDCLPIHGRSESQYYTKEDLEDLAQEGYIGLLLAAYRWDPHFQETDDNRSTFSSFAIPTIRGTINNSAGQLDTNPIPPQQNELYSLFSRVEDILWQIGATEPSMTQTILMTVLIKTLEAKPATEEEAVNILYDLAQTLKPSNFPRTVKRKAQEMMVSLTNVVYLKESETTGTADIPLIEQVPDDNGSVGYEETDRKVLQEQRVELISRLLNELDERQQIILWAVKVEGKTYKDVACELGISTARIGQLLIRAERKIKNFCIAKRILIQDFI
ncbi:sigma-70 family RNA polymerase sigma factor [Candidatus Roizmanbacteria bacterium]|nr:sigma-70 family RNA polymerase sigma factor [Candidatus Roizmanbacteria bacterium]